MPADLVICSPQFSRVGPATSCASLRSAGSQFARSKTGILGKLAIIKAEQVRGAAGTFRKPAIVWAANKFAITLARKKFETRLELFRILLIRPCRRLLPSRFSAVSQFTSVCREVSQRSAALSQFALSDLASRSTCWPRDPLCSLRFALTCIARARAGANPFRSQPPSSLVQPREVAC